MTEKNQNSAKLGLKIGIIGTIAGILLMLGDNVFIGLFGAIASAGIAYKGYRDLQELKK